MRNIARLTMMAMGFAVLTTACGSADNTDNSTTNKVIQRQAIPDNEFKPTELETTINSLVTEIGKTPAAAVKVGVLLKDLAGFWAPVATGANRAISELQVTGTVAGPISPTGDLMEDVQLQETFMQQALTQYNAQAIAPQSIDLNASIDAAAAQGIPVVTIDSDAAASMRDLYVGTINLQAGITGGKTLLAMLPPGPGTVILLGNTDPGWTDGIDRTSGAQGVLAAAGYTVVVQNTTWTSTGEAEDVAALQADITNANPPAVGMLGVFGVAFRCAMAAEALGKTGADISIVAFDFDPKTVSYMQSGLIKATHAQRQYYEGYLAPYVLYGIKALGLAKTKSILSAQMVDDTRFDTGVDVVPADKVDVYNAFLDSIGANTQ